MRILDPKFVDSVKEEVLASFDELSPEEVILGLAEAIRSLALLTSNPGQALDEVVLWLDRDGEDEEENLGEDFSQEYDDS